MVDGIKIDAIQTDSLQQSQIMASSVFNYLLIIGFVLSFVYWKLSRRHMIKLAQNIPGPDGLPIVGHALDFIGTSHSVFKTIIKIAKDYDNIIRLWIGPTLTVFISDPRDVELVLSSQVYLDKSSEYSFFKPWLGNGLLISSGHTWRSHRKLIAPTFHLNVLKSFIDLFNENSRHVVDKMKLENGKTFDCHDYMSECTVEILLETAMGVSKKTQDQSGYEYAKAVMKMCDILHLRHRKLWLRPNWLFNLTQHSKKQIKLLDIIHGLTRRVIKKKRAAFKLGTRGSLAKTTFTTDGAQDDNDNDDTLKDQNVQSVEGLSFGQSSQLKDDLDIDDNDVGQKKRLAFLDLLLESADNGALLSDEEIKEQVDTIMFEGHDTTAAGSSFFLSLMGIHTHIQDKVVQELDEIFGTSDRPATFQDTLEMKYLERCLMETLRMYPPVPIIARHLKSDLKLASGDYTVPSGATIVVATFRLHHRDDIYPKSDVFDPDNFLPERQANRHYYAFVPFSAGPRSCVGRKYAMLKLKILLSTILRKYRIHSDIKESDFKLQGDIILKREEGFQIRLEPRNIMAKTTVAAK